MNDLLPTMQYISQTLNTQSSNAEANDGDEFTQLLGQAVKAPSAETKERPQQYDTLKSDLLTTAKDVKDEYASRDEKDDILDTINESFTLNLSDVKNETPKQSLTEEPTTITIDTGYNIIIKNHEKTPDQTKINDGNIDSYSDILDGQEKNQLQAIYPHNEQLTTLPFEDNSGSTTIELFSQKLHKDHLSQRQISHAKKSESLSLEKSTTFNFTHQASPTNTGEKSDNTHHFSINLLSKSITPTDHNHQIAENMTIELQQDDIPSTSLIHDKLNIAQGVSQQTTTHDNNMISTKIDATIDDKQWSSHISDRIHWLASQKIDKAQIHINPPELGPIEAHIKMQNGKSEIILVSQHGQIRELMEQAIPKLKTLFDENKMELNQVDISDQSPNLAQDSSYQQAKQSSANLQSDDDQNTITQKTSTLSKNKGGTGVVDYYA